MNYGPNEHDITKTDDEFKEGMDRYLGVDSPPDYEKAFSLFISSNSVFGRIMAAVIIEQGKVLSDDIDLSDIKEEELIFDDGPLSDLIKGLMNEFGIVFKNDDEKAFGCFMDAADKGNVRAQYILGHLCSEGTGTEQSYEKAAEWYLKSAEQGDTDAMLDLSLMYQFGEGVEQSDEGSFRWITKAAEQGNGDAQYNLFLKYLQGNGVDQSDEEAAKWCKLAAQNGIGIAQFNLGVMYANGTGVNTSKEEAKKWLTLAADQGIDEASQILDMIDQF